MIVDFTKKPGDADEVKHCLGYEMPTFQNYMNNLPMGKAEHAYTYIMNQKNHERILEYIVNGIEHTNIIKDIVGLY